MVNVTKRNGELAPYNPAKIRIALKRSGAKSYIINEVLEEIKPILYEGISTEKIFKTVFKLVKQRQKSTASKFGLRGSIAKLGPQGHHFETFIAHILREKGYETKARQILNGKSITHEIDVVAKKGNEKIVVECKFHSQHWTYSPIQDALYTYARFLDIQSNKKNKVTGVMLCTNTRFSRDVINYSKGVRMKLLGWRYPSNQGLEKIIDKRGLYPITSLQGLNNLGVEKLLENHVVIIKDLAKMNDQKIKRTINCGDKKLQNLRKEMNELLKN